MIPKSWPDADRFTQVKNLARDGESSGPWKILRSALYSPKHSATTNYNTAKVTWKLTFTCNLNFHTLRCF